MATASRDKTARVWNVSTGKQIIALKHDYSVAKAFFSPDGKYIATLSNNTAYLWSVSTEKKRYFET